MGLLAWPSSSEHELTAFEGDGLLDEMEDEFSQSKTWLMVRGGGEKSRSGLNRDRTVGGGKYR
jgi:hypothetical protein